MGPSSGIFIIYHLRMRAHTSNPTPTRKRQVKAHTSRMQGLVRVWDSGFGVYGPLQIMVEGSMFGFCGWVLGCLGGRAQCSFCNCRPILSKKAAHLSMTVAFCKIHTVTVFAIPWKLPSSVPLGTPLADSLGSFQKQRPSYGTEIARLLLQGHPPQGTPNICRNSSFALRRKSLGELKGSATGGTHSWPTVKAPQSHSNGDKRLASSQVPKNAGTKDHISG